MEKKNKLLIPPRLTARASRGFLFYMKNKERVIVCIDGSNLYFRLKKLLIPHTSQFNFRGLAEYLTQGKTLTEINYYVGVVQLKGNNDKAYIIQQGQLTLFNTLIEQNIKIIKGFLMKSNGVYHEKGVDVNIAVDLLVGAYENHFDTAVLLSSDTDLIPAIQKIKSLGKKLQYVGFKPTPSIALINHCTFFKILEPQEVSNFTKKHA